MELLKWLDASNRARLLDLINNWWTERKAPQELFIARVVPIFKKDEADDAANYWEKAFDKIQHDKLILALQRMGFSSQFCDVIGGFYKEPTFFVKDDFGLDVQVFKRQSAGIRQGCPLSPHLFVIVMSCIDFDIRARCSRWVSNGRVPGLEFDMVYYADDTILFSTDNRALNELLHLTEVISSKYGLCLNKNKCVAIQMNNDGSDHFDNQEPLPKRFGTKFWTKCKK